MKFDKIWEYRNMGSPSNEDAKIHPCYLFKLGTSQFQDTQANIKEK